MPRQLSYIVNRLRRKASKRGHPGTLRGEAKSFAARRYRTDFPINQPDAPQATCSLAVAGGSVWRWNSEDFTFKADQIGNRLAGLKKDADIVDCLEPEHWQHLHADLEQCRIDGSPIRREVRCRRPDGQWLWLDIRGGRLCGHGQENDTVSGVFWDITDNKLDQLALQSESHNKDRFIAKLSHEMRTPLSAILGYCKQAEKRANDQNLLNDLAVVRNNGEFLSRLTEELLDLSRIVAGKVQLEERSVDIHALLRDLVSATTLRAIEKSIDFTVAPTPMVQQHVITDPVRLRQILQNLIDNAIKFTDEGEINFAVTSEHNISGDTLVFEIRDTGRGIRSHDLERVFQPFAQLDAGVNGNDGIGLGLAVSQQLAELLGGHIDVESKCGRGSVFRLRLALPDRNSVHASTTGVAKIETVSERPLPNQATVADSDRSVGNVTVSRVSDANSKVTDVADGRAVLDFSPLHTQTPRRDDIKAVQRLRDTVEDQPKVAMNAGVASHDQTQCPARDFARMPATTVANEHLSAICVRCFQATDPDGYAKGNRVLIVEDHHALARLTQQQLQRYGYDVRVAHSGKEAEQRMASWTPTTVIMDLALPDTCGMALCRRMKSLPEFATCRFVAYSGRSEPNDQLAAFAVGFDDYLLKPAKPAALQAAVR